MFNLLYSILWGSDQRRFWLRFLVVLIFGTIFWGLWLSFGGKVSARKDYLVGINDIRICATPDWIPATFIEEAFDRRPLVNDEVLNILDPRLGQKLALVFESHPWVERVESIRTEYPAHVLADVRFRKPVAFVAAPKEHYAEGAFPVDANGVLLPTDFFQKNQDLLNEFLWIEGIKSIPMGSYGDFWGDPLVAEAAMLAEFLMSDRPKLGLKKIVLLSGSDEKSGQYNLYTEKGQKIRWGTFPMPVSLSGNRDASSREKFARIKKEIYQKQNPKLVKLCKMAQQYGSLDGIPEKERDLDVSMLGEN